MDHNKYKLGLLVAHSIFLTREERYSLVAGNPVRVVGVSLPVWFLTETGKTSEPASEIFCEYHLFNRDEEQFVRSIRTGYEMNLPQLPEDYVPPIKPSNETWRKWKMEEKERWYDRHPVPVSASNLKDVTDKGGEYLRFEHMRDAMLDNEEISVIHAVEIKTIEDLKSSILV